MTCTNAAEHYYSHSPCLLGGSQYKLYCMFHMPSGMYSYNKRVIMSLY